MLVLVTGATGMLGRAVVRHLVGVGHDVRAMTHTARPADDVDRVQADLATGEGVEAAVADVTAIVHAATAAHKGRRTVRVDVEGTDRLLAAARSAGVGHIVYPSIVGIDSAPVEYGRHKLHAERLVERGGVPFSIVRLTQFHPWLDRLLSWTSSRLRLFVGDPRWRFQPMDLGEAAARLVERLDAGPAGTREDVGGPEVLTYREIVDQWATARGRRRRLLPTPVPGRLGRAQRDGRLTTSALPTTKITWSEYLAGGGLHDRGRLS